MSVTLEIDGVDEIGEAALLDVADLILDALREGHNIRADGVSLVEDPTVKNLGAGPGCWRMPSDDELTAIRQRWDENNHASIQYCVVIDDYRDLSGGYSGRLAVVVHRHGAAVTTHELDDAEIIDPDGDRA